MKLKHITDKVMDNYQFQLVLVDWAMDVFQLTAVGLNLNLSLQQLTKECLFTKRQKCDSLFESFYDNSNIIKSFKTITF